MRILLTGVDGQVGFELQRALAPLAELVPSTQSGRLPGGGVAQALDLSALEGIPSVLDAIAPDVVVNPAAYTAVDRAESESELAFRINAEAPARLARWCAKHDALLVHFSTDYVFDGHGSRPWREHDPTAPTCVYGASKLAGEQAIRSSGCRHLILRTAWVYSARFSNFLKTMLRLARERDEIAVVDDQIGTPTTARGLAQVTAALLARSERLDDPAQLGTFHCTYSGQTSWYGFADALFVRAVESGLLAQAPRLRAIPSSAYPTAARRPAFSVLDNGRLREIHGLTLPDWRTGLDEVIAELVTR